MSVKIMPTKRRASVLTSGTNDEREKQQQQISSGTKQIPHDNQRWENKNITYNNDLKDITSGLTDISFKKQKIESNTGGFSERYINEKNSNSIKK